MRIVQTLMLACVLVIGCNTSAQAQSYAFDWNPRSSDAWVDARLADINRYGERYRDPFIDELVRYHDAPRELIIHLLTVSRWAPGDVYFACALAKIATQPCRDIADIWERDHAQGWAAVAKALGIKPGSTALHTLKRGIVPSYDRWGRPIELDRDLLDEFPGRGKNAARDADHGKE